MGPRRVRSFPRRVRSFLFGGKQTSEQAKLTRRQQGKSNAKRIQCNENGNILVSAFRLKRLYQIRLFPQCWQSPAMTSCYPDSMIRAFGEDARSNAVNDRARVLMICLYMPALASERGCPIRTQPLPQLPAWPWKTNSITLRCGGALSSRVLCYLNASTIEYTIWSIVDAASGEARP